MTEGVRITRSTNLIRKGTAYSESTDTFLFGFVGGKDERPLVGSCRIFLIQILKWVF
jgi:hypothetical protein